MSSLTHLQRLEAEAIHVMREVVAEADHPVMLYSIGKDSSVMLRLAMKAFYPGKPPFPLLHVDTTWKFREMILFRDRMAAELGLDLLVHVNEDGLAMNISPIEHGSVVHTDIMKTQSLKQALYKYGFDAAFGGARRDEEKSRAKERIFSFRTAQHQWDPKNQRPELWRLYNARKHQGESMRVFPLSNWTELDVWQYIYLEDIPVVPLYFARERPVVERDGALIMVDDDRMPLKPGEAPMLKKVRFRTLGCYPLTGAIESEADTLPAILREMLFTRRSERQGRVIDHDQNKTLLRFLTCGSVDDGKSTLIGRFLCESKLLFEDQLVALEADSKKSGTQGGELDYALLLDGLAAEREQGITIDVAYRYFSTERRKYIVADTPGDERYTRNMVTGASTADAAIILIDARKGVLTQTRRHSYLVSLLGIRHLLLAVNKMDLVDYAEATFRSIEADYRTFARRLGLEDVTCVPVSALKGDNILAHGENMPWYRGPTLMSTLETVEVDADRMQRGPFRLPVQWVNRPNPDFRGFSGTIVSGVVQPGDRVRVAPSGRESKVARIVAHGGDLDRAIAGQAITLTLADEIDISRGDVVCTIDAPASVADQFRATIVWMSDAPMLPGRSYLLKIGARTVSATVGHIRHKVDVNTLEELAARELALNEIGVCNLSTDRPIAFDPYVENRDTGGFILIDRLTNDTVGGGLLHFALRRAQNIHVQAVDVDKVARAGRKSQKPCILWFTGLPGSGKSTIANLVEKHLHALGRHTYLLEGDNVRHGLNKDLGFTDAERVENVRRVAEVAKLMVDAGLIVLVSFISPFRSERRMARGLVEAGEFVEIFVDAPLAVAEARDPKGLYKKARRGELPHFTGIDSPYEAPQAAELRLDTTRLSAQQAAEVIIDHLRQAGAC